MMASKPLSTVLIWTDGSCRKNPGGPGGWACLLRYGDIERELSGAMPPPCTNNRAEMMAAIMALEALKRPCSVILYTDSLYVKKGMTIWRLYERKSAKNDDLWWQLARAAAPHKVKWKWVRGHNGHPENERVDALAGAAY